MLTTAESNELMRQVAAVTATNNVADTHAGGQACYSRLVITTNLGYSQAFVSDFIE